MLDGSLGKQDALRLRKERLSSCDVKTFNNYIKEITVPAFNIELEYGKPDFRKNMREALQR